MIRFMLIYQVLNFAQHSNGNIDGLSIETTKHNLKTVDFLQNSYNYHKAIMFTE